MSTTGGSPLTSVTNVAGSAGGTDVLAGVTSTVTNGGASQLTSATESLPITSVTESTTSTGGTDLLGTVTGGGVGSLAKLDVLTNVGQTPTFLSEAPAVGDTLTTATSVAQSSQSAQSQQRAHVQQTPTDKILQTPSRLSTMQGAQSSLDVVRMAPDRLTAHQMLALQSSQQQQAGLGVVTESLAPALLKLDVLSGLAPSVKETQYVQSNSGGSRRLSRLSAVQEQAGASGFATDQLVQAAPAPALLSLDLLSRRPEFLSRFRTVSGNS